jgi:hypothetical protein
MGEPRESCRQPHAIMQLLPKVAESSPIDLRMARQVLGW